MEQPHTVNYPESPESCRFNPVFAASLLISTLNVSGGKKAKPNKGHFIRRGLDALYDVTEVAFLVDTHSDMWSM